VPLQGELPTVDDRLVAQVDAAESARLVDRQPVLGRGDDGDRPAVALRIAQEIVPDLDPLVGRPDRVRRDQTDAAADRVRHDAVRGEEPVLVVTQREVVEGPAAVPGDQGAGALPLDLVCGT